MNAYAKIDEDTLEKQVYALGECDVEESFYNR